MTSASSGSKILERRLGRGWVLGLALALLAVPAREAAAKIPFLFNGEAIHPACVHALVMHAGDRIPVTTAVSLEGCMASERAKHAVEYEGEYLSFRDGPLLGGGSFGYKEIARLDNGLVVLAMQRIDAQGERQVSLAAVDLAHRPMIRNREVVKRLILEMVGEVWVEQIDVGSVAVFGNRVNFYSGLGSERQENNVDLSRIGRARDRKK